jgi:ubiquinone/menaquinone biosynthesis C-methylase UbiE
MAGRRCISTFGHGGWDKDSVALKYHRNFGELGCVPDLLNAAHLKGGHRVFDMACGAGYVAAAAHYRGADAIGLAFSTAIWLVEQTYPGIQFVEGDAEALSFPDR